MKTWDDFEKEYYDKDGLEEIKRIAKFEATHETNFFLDALDKGKELTYDQIVELTEEKEMFDLKERIERLEKNPSSAKQWKDIRRRAKETEICQDVQLGKYTVLNVPTISLSEPTPTGEYYIREASIDFKLADIYQYMKEHNILVVHFADFDEFK